MAMTGAQCEHTPACKGQKPYMCFFNMHKLHLPVVLQQQRMSNTAWPASSAVEVQGASCCCCQDGLQVVCQLLQCDTVTSHISGNIHQPALLGKQVGVEHSTPCQSAIYRYVLAEDQNGVRLVSCRQDVKAQAKAEAEAKAVHFLARVLTQVQQPSVQLQHRA